MFRTPSRLLGALLLLGTLATPAMAGDVLEVFSNQQPVLIGINQPKVLKLLGALYGETNFLGKVRFQPQTTGSCRIFFRGESNVAAKANTTNIVFGLEVLVPKDHPLGDAQCTLQYTAVQVDALGNETPFPVRGNTVTIPYTVKKRFQP